MAALRSFVTIFVGGIIGIPDCCCCGNFVSIAGASLSPCTGGDPRRRADAFIRPVRQATACL